MILAVALDTGGAAAARSFVEAESLASVPEPLRGIMGWDEALWSRAERPRFPCLLDETHRVARLYGLTNVPSAVWIDEAGCIVRPPEPAGVFDVVRHIDLATLSVPEEISARGQAVRRAYLEALRRWVREGVVPEAPQPSGSPENETDSLGAAHFQLGAYLFRHGHPEEARAFFEEAVRLCPESWIYRRQKIAVASPEALGQLAATPEYWEAVRKLGERPYYPPIDLPGMPR